ncbi:MAG TPA: RidA family protein [Phycisphaerales bacterium]|nr:RidA family protein [Phycisphaerales bacterium]
MTRRKDHVVSSSAPESVGAYPHARVANGFVFLSGVGPRVRGTTEIPGVVLGENGEMVSYSIEDQCRSCFANVRAVLEDAGSHWNNIVDVLVFLTDMNRDFEAFNRLYREYFAGDGQPNPTRTTIEINKLPQGGSAPIAIELKVIATI